MPVNSMPLTIGEILQQIKDAKSKPERVAILKEHDGFALRHFLRLAFDPSIKMSLPEGKIPYTPNPKPNTFGDTTLKTAVGGGGFYVFFQSSAPNMRASKRTILFTQLLEQLDKQEAEFLHAAKDKNLDVGLTRKVIDEVYPGLLSGAGITEEANETKTKGPKASSNS